MHTWLKKIVLASLFVIAVTLFAACNLGDDDLAVAAVTVAGANTVQVGTPAAYTATILPADATDKSITWSVNNVSGEATINQNGILTPVSPGSVQVVAKAHNDVQGTRTVTITAGRIPVSMVTITGAANVALNKTATYIAQVQPLDATDPSVLWSVSPGTGSAEINQNGQLTPLTEGTVTVVAVADGFPAEKHVLITAAEIPVTGADILIPDTLYEFDETQLSYTVYPENATYETVTWTLINQSGEGILSPGGYLTLLKPGTVTVRLTIGNHVEEILYTIETLPNLITDFIVSRDGFFFEGESEEPFKFLGTNNYTLHYKSDAMIDDAIRQAADMGIKVIRMWAFFDGWEDEGRANYAYGQLEPGVFTQSPEARYGEVLYDRNTGEVKPAVHVLDRVDYAIHRAGQHGIRVKLVLTNYYPEFGGMLTYVKWHNDLFGTSYSGRGQFYTNETIKTWYKNWVEHVVNRTNTITGVPYKEDPVIFAWQLANEPDGANVHIWADEMSAYLKNDLGVSQMVSVGAQGSLGHAPSTLTINKDTADGRIADDDDFHYEFVRQGVGGNYYGYGTSVNHWAILQLEHIDYSTAHLYPDHWRIPPDRAIEYGEKFIRDHAALAKYWGMPLILEEFGIMRSTHDESLQIHRDLAYDTWLNALYEMDAYGMFWILTGIEDSPDSDADGNYPDFDGFRVLNDGGSTAMLLREYAKLYNGEIETIERTDRMIMLSPLHSQITRANTFRVEVKVFEVDKTVEEVLLYVHGQAPIVMNHRTDDPYRTGIYDHVLNMQAIEPGEDYTIKAVVRYTDGTELETVPRNVRRYIFLELDTLFVMDFNAEQTINFQTFGSYEAQLRSIHHNKTLELLELDILNSSGHWSEHKVKLIAFPPTSGGLPMIPNTFRVQYTTLYNKEIVDALGGNPTLKNYIALEPGWVKTGIDANNVTINTIRTNADKDDSDPTKRSDIGVRWIDLNGDGIETPNELFYFQTVTIEFVPNDTLNAIAINPTTGGMPYDGVMYIDDVILYGYADGAPIDSLEPDPDFEFDLGE